MNAREAEALAKEMYDRLHRDYQGNALPRQQSYPLSLLPWAEWIVQAREALRETRVKWRPDYGGEATDRRIGHLLARLDALMPVPKKEQS